MFPRLNSLFSYVGSAREFLHSTFVNGVYKSRFESYPQEIAGLGVRSNACLLSPHGIAINPSLAVKTSFSFTPEHDIFDSVDAIISSLDSVNSNNE